MKRRKVYLLDANVILRYLTNDIPSQRARAKKLFKRVQDLNYVVKILPITLIEVIYHLGNRYRLPRSKIAELIKTFISPNWIYLDNKEEVLEALELYKSSKIDMVDILLFVHAKYQGYEVASFDKDFDKLKRLTGFTKPVLHKL